MVDILGGLTSHGKILLQGSCGLGCILSYFEARFRLDYF